MTNVLTPPITSPEFVQAPAEAGIFLEEFLESKGNDIKQALYVLESIQAARGVISTAQSCPKLVSGSSLEDAKATVADHGAIWRRETDKVSYGLASKYPGHAITSKYIGPGYFTDEKRLCRQQNGGDFWIFSSFLSQNELDEGMKIATEDMWQDLLIRLLATAPQKTERTREGRAVVQLMLTEGIL